LLSRLLLAAAPNMPQQFILHFTLTLIERFLDTVSPMDYRILVETLQPEMVKAKRLTTGKQITAVSPLNQ